MSPIASLVNRRTGQGLSAFGFITVGLVVLFVVALLSNAVNGLEFSSEVQARIDRANETITNASALVDQAKAKPRFTDLITKRIGNVEGLINNLRRNMAIYENGLKDAVNPNEEAQKSIEKTIDELISKLTRKMDALEHSSLHRAWDWSNKDWKHRIGVGAGTLAVAGAATGSVYWIIQKVVNRWKTPEQPPQPTNVTNSSSQITTEKKPQSGGFGLSTGWIVIILIIMLLAGGFMYYYLFMSSSTSEGEEEPNGVKVDVEAAKSQIEAKQGGDGSNSGETILPSIRSTAKPTTGSNRRPSLDKSKPKSGKPKSSKTPKTSSEKSASESSTFVSTGSSSVD